MGDNKQVVGRIVDRIRDDIPNICSVAGHVGSYQANLVEILYGNLLGSAAIFYDRENYSEIRDGLQLGRGVLTISDLQLKGKDDEPHFDCSIFKYERDGKRMNFHGYVDSRVYNDRINLSFNSRMVRVRNVHELDDQASIFVIGDNESITSAFNCTVADSMFRLLNKYLVSDRGQYQVKHI